MYAGLRLGELRALRAKDVDLAGGVIRVERGWDPVEGEIKLRSHGREPKLLERITPHECRHTFASLMIAAGVNPKALSTFRGPANISITLDRYGT